jgi:D-serine deaminase-like pyridoxal phosphate-dependent protein
MSVRGKWTRRAALTGASAAVLSAGFVWATREGDHGGPHSDYFLQLSAALKKAGVAQPAMIVDLQRLQDNIEAVKRELQGTLLELRVVVKSLPSIRLIERIADSLGTQRFMVFNGPMLLEMATRRPTSDLLLGKPLSVVAAENFYKEASARKSAFKEPQWLIDTTERLRQYGALARRLDRRLRINFEIDVGLHRGGFADRPSLEQAIDVAMDESLLIVEGLMGYDAHVPKMPSVESAYKKSQDLYRIAVEALKEQLPHREFALNAAGSPTYALHAKNTVANEVSVGSAFVKPTDFDIETLSRHVPAAFIATPVIKSLPSAQVPGLEMLTSARRLFDANTARAFFIHGGHWLAKPESPPGLEYSDLYGRSSNQELLTGSESIELQPDDFVFLRPTQSEAIFLQFGDLLVYDGKDIVDRWPTFPVSA